MKPMNLKKPGFCTGKRRIITCCIGGWIYQEPYGWVICADHEAEAKKKGKPSDYFVDYFKGWLLQ